jgi:hypothetical protein
VAGHARGRETSGGAGCSLAAQMDGRNPIEQEMAGTPARQGSRRPGWAAALAVERDRGCAARVAEMHAGRTLGGRQGCSLAAQMAGTPARHRTGPAQLPIVIISFFSLLFFLSILPSLFLHLIFVYLVLIAFFHHLMPQNSLIRERISYTAYTNDERCK